MSNSASTHLIRKAPQPPAKQRSGVWGRYFHARRVPRSRWGRPVPGQANRPGGTIINLITAVVLFGLLALAAWWVIKGLGEAGREYSGAMINATRKATMIACQNNLQVIGQNIQVYTISGEGYPASLQALREWSGSSQLFECPDPNGGRYVYITGQNGDMSGENILVYEPNAVHNGCCNILRLSGRVEPLTPEQLNQALVQTRAEISSPRR